MKLIYMLAHQWKLIFKSSGYTYNTQMDKPPEVT